MTEANVHDAWNVFWERQSRRSGADAKRGSQPEAWQGIAERQRRVWLGLARTLPKGANVLDLATGDGMVLSCLQEKRRDLKLTGIDRATALPNAPRGIKLRGGVNMADLPFPDDHFAAVTSQFGFEYGDIAAVASEVTRVLKPDGKFALLTHRIDGPIVAHNRKRRAQIAWALEENDLVTVAKNSLSLRKAGIAAIPQAIIEAPEMGAKAHGPNSAAWEIAEAIRQTLHFGRNDDPQQVAALLDEILAQARNELGRIASLEVAAATASDSESMLEAMEKAGLREAEQAMVTDGRSPSPFADYWVFILAD
ncbi:class I SAM-dependent methyltransferase [Erythrobacter alti]|uniref:class I SAM-dependent methyltransferase n=1 Tax=Erythrobacter alti TaxID=1896145 RepID=UPI0030F3C6BA